MKNITVGSLMNLNYTYDKSGNLRKINSTATVIETQNFTYDTLDRLVTANATGGPANYSETYAHNSTTGNLTTKGSLTLQYNDSAHVHAVTSAGSNTYSYDSNGNQTTRVIGGQTYTLGYDAENRLLTVTGPSMNATFVYDGDGARVKSTINSTTTYFVGGHYEVTSSQVTKYYFAGSQRVAVRKSGTLSYMLSDHLGSTVATTNTSGQLVSGQLYKAWGEVRYSLGTSPTKYTYTGQYSNVSEFGLMFYNARWYDPYLSRFAQADTIVPLQSQGVQAWDRYAYVNNTPLIYIDPSGHCGVKEGKFDGKFDCTAEDINAATMKQRLAWFKGFLAVTGREKWFTNIIGILQAFIDEGLGDTNSWVSWVDAGILESIQNGWALFKEIGLTRDPTAADMAWRNFFATSDTPQNETALKQLWGAAENLGTRYGLSLAEHYGVEANWREKLFLYVGDKFYRDLLASGQMEETYGTAGEMAGMISCGPLALTCATIGYIGGYKVGEWFGDPRSTVPFTDKAPVYFLAITILEK